MESAVNELVDMLKEPLSEEEMAKMISEEANSQNNEPDPYTFVLNCFTQKNTEALVKCTYRGRSLNLIISISTSPHLSTSSNLHLISISTSSHFHLISPSPPHHISPTHHLSASSLHLHLHLSISTSSNLHLISPSPSPSHLCISSLHLHLTTSQSHLSISTSPHLHLISPFPSPSQFSVSSLHLHLTTSPSHLSISISISSLHLQQWLNKIKLPKRKSHTCASFAKPEILHTTKIYFPY